MQSYSQLKSKGLPKNVASLYARQPRENALKGSADYSALIIQRRYKRRAGSKPALSNSQIIYANDVTNWFFVSF